MWRGSRAQLTIRRRNINERDKELKEKKKEEKEEEKEEIHPRPSSCVLFCVKKIWSI